MTHILKVWPGEFEAVQRGVKLHEVRRNDRDFSVGDSLILREFIPKLDQTTGQPARDENGSTIGTFTSHEVLRYVTYITPGGAWGLPADICVLSIK
ncbi:MAG TPA: DUF3850 domain-containing protein [Chthoniobacterales bacterium]|nr:DUF3850 domain-containing protein [Chthoniobacterales bacterium]